MKASPVLTMTARVHVDGRAGLDAAEVRVRWSDSDHPYGAASWGLTAWRFALRRPEYLDGTTAAGWAVDRAEAIRNDPDAWRWDVGRDAFGPPSLGARVRRGASRQAAENSVHPAPQPRMMPFTRASHSRSRSDKTAWRRKPR